jgi:hypothetical protein
MSWDVFPSGDGSAVTRESKILSPRLHRLRLVEGFDYGVENFVFACGNAGDGGLDADVGPDAVATWARFALRIRMA